MRENDLTFDGPSGGMDSEFAGLFHFTGSRDVDQNSSWLRWRCSFHGGGRRDTLRCGPRGIRHNASQNKGVYGYYQTHPLTPADPATDALGVPMQPYAPLDFLRTLKKRRAPDDGAGRRSG